MDVLSKLKIKVDLEKKSWYTDKKIVRPFFPKLKDPEIIVATACIGGVSELSPHEQSTLNALTEKYISKKEGKLGIARITLYCIDVQGSTPIKQPLRRTSPKLLAQAYVEVDRLLVVVLY